MRRAMTQDEIAKMLGISRSMVYKIEQNAMRKIRECIKRESACKEYQERYGMVAKEPART